MFFYHFTRDHIRRHLPTDTYIMSNIYIVEDHNDSSDDEILTIDDSSDDEILTMNDIRKRKKRRTCVIDSDDEETTQNERPPQNDETSKLLRDGYVVVPVLDNGLEHREQLRADLKAALSSMQEYCAEGTQYVIGSFGGLGTPSSFHHHLIRSLRKVCYERAKHLFANMDGRLEMLIDRFMVRCGTIGKEAAHRDCAENAEPGDSIFGGYLNTDIKPQKMLLAPGTQLATNSGTGFAKLSKEQSKAYEEQMVTVMVPPGHMIVFYANIVHSVAPQKVKEPIYRLFIGWRLTQSTEPLMGWSRHHKVFTDQGVPPLPSGQEAPMYARLHWTNWPDALERFASNLIVRCRTDRKVMSGKNAGKTFTVPISPMPSLRELDLELYPEYTTEELSMYIPNLLN